MSTPRSLTPSRRFGLALTALALAVGGAACGNDDGDSTASGGGDTASTAPPATGDDAAFCAGVVTADVASFQLNGGEAPDPALVDAAKKALAPLKDLAPADISDDVTTAVDDAMAMFDGGDEPETFSAAMASIHSWVGDNCGFNEVSVEAEDYHFTGLPDEIEAGPALLRLDNKGTELHELMMLKVKDGETRSTDEILALPEEEAQALVEQMGGVFATPGADGTSTADLAAGRYLVICAIPVGLTPEAIGAAEAGGEEPQLGPPHFTQGMVHELTVT